MAVEAVLPASGVITNALGAFGSEGYKIIGQRVINSLAPEERRLINHDIQRTFRLAVDDALAEISGDERAEVARRDPRGMSDDVRFRFAELSADLREPMRACFADLRRAVAGGTLLPITAAAGSDESAASYLDQSSLAMLSSASGEDRATLRLLAELFYDETIAPWLVAHAGFSPPELAPLARHLRRHLLPRTLVHFNERIKDPANTAERMARGSC